MMKYPFQLGSLAIMVVGLMSNVFCPTMADARIGERRESIERRLLNSGGIVYRDDTIESNRRRGMPYLKYMEYLPSSVEVRIYFKTSDGRRPTSSELEEKRMLPGWDLHVLYAGGESVIEVYKRSQGMSEYEFNQLLALHAEGGYWKRPNKNELAETVSAFGFEMVRSDERVRAKKLGGDSLMLFDAELDVKLAEMNTSNLLEAAPVSVEGF